MRRDLLRSDDQLLGWTLVGGVAFVLAMVIGPHVRAPRLPWIREHVCCSCWIDRDEALPARCFAGVDTFADAAQLRWGR